MSPEYYMKDTVNKHIIFTQPFPGENYVTIL
jgi:hypothetical protein